MRRTDSFSGRAVLMAAHVAGMIDLVALPVWIGTLMPHYQLDPQQAGGLVTAFLLGAVASSLWFAPRFNRLRGTLAAPWGFALAALAFGALASTRHYGLMALLHGVAGVAAGCALSFTHGTIGRSANPHRLFALAGMALGVFAIVFLGAVPQVVKQFGGPALFLVFSGVMLVAAVACAVGFPALPASAGGPVAGPAAVLAAAPKPLGPGVWLGMLGVSCMAVSQATTFSFVERIGVARGFGEDRVLAVLIAVGFINLLPAVLAVALQRRWPAQRVALLAPLVQAALALVITQSTGFAPYAAAASVFVFVMIFTHTFVFGLMAQQDASGRAVASTPAMLMTGSALGPLLGGTLAHQWGYASLGLAVLAVSLLAVACFWGMARGAHAAAYAA